MVAYIRSDLEFILNQIKIAEAHAAGQPLYGPGGLIPSYNLAWGLRTVDGTYNHLLPGQEHWGAADQPFPELLEPDFREVVAMVDFDGPGGADPVPVTLTYTPGVDADGPGPNAGPGDVIDPEVRTISNLIVDQTLGNPAAILTALQRAGVDPGQQMAIAAEITNAYAPLRPLFQAVAVAERENATAAAAANASPGNAALQQAAADAAANLAAARAALDAADDDLMALLEANGIELDGANVHLPNVAPDEGLSASFNSWFTLFGQFFDHGLDLVNKGDSGTVMIPLQPDDPLYVEGSDTNFMVLTRATVGPGADGIMVDDPNTEVDESADNTRPVNTTTPFVDQNQTYTSHPSHQVFLREHVLTPDGPAATGKLIEGANGGMATWAEVKAQAREILGINLTDSDVGRVPLLRTDPYGNFIPGDNGFPQVIFGIGADGIPNTADDVVVEGDPSANGGTGISLEGAVRTNHAFLADIAHTAVPTDLADGDIEIGLGNGDGSQTDGFYDNELLDAHFIAGDGRANENIGLTAVHHVFHAEHNRLVEHTKDIVLSDAQALFDAGASNAEAVAFLNEWLAVDVTELPADPSSLIWDGERLFQAAKFGTEMQYQHLVFEEFARKVQPTINTFLVPDGFDTTLDPSIVAEFAHVVYRFGHSMLTESIDQFDPSFQPNHISLIQGFLNPTAFNGVNGVIDDEIAAGAIVRGMTRQVGNEIDEFVTSALRNNLLGLPLDLATINLARGRDTGVPSLNAARAEFYEASNQNILLKPYESWVDFASHLKHEASIINFIAAYGTHSLITDETTIEGKRDAALQLLGLSEPTETVAETINNFGFEADSLAVPGGGVISHPNGNYTTTAPTGWTLTGEGGLIDPADGVVEPTGVEGTNVAWLRQGGVLSQDTGVALEADVSYRLTLDIGDRTDLGWPGGTARLLSNGEELASVALTAPADGDWTTVVVETGPLEAAQAAGPLTIEIVHAGGTDDQILIDNVRLDAIQPTTEVEDRLDFLNGTGDWAGVETGLNNVDFWIGGLAEEIMPFGGMLGSTFNFVFEVQMEMLQSGDRFYYLQRLDGLHLFGEMENNSFAAMIMRNTDATHLPSDVFSTPGLILEVDKSRQYNPDTGVFLPGADGVLGDDPATTEVDESLDDVMDTNADPVGSGILTQLVVRDNPSTPGVDTNYLRYNGDDHVVLGGTDPGNASNPSGNDVLIAGIGDDTIYGDGGDDFLNGGFGNDIINGGDGDDIIVDSGGDDNIKAGSGHDVVHAGPGLDLVLAGPGQDFVFLGTDEGSEVFGGEGNDFIYGNKNAERILGNEGDDWIETGTFDGAPGDNFDEIFAQDSVDGHDVFLGDGGFDEFIGEGGDDIMVGSPGRGKMVGMSGFDWATYKDNTFGVNADIGRPIIFDESPVFPENASLDGYESVEGLSGSAFDDVLTGTDETAATLLPTSQGGTGGGYRGSMLDAAGIARIAGLQEVLGAGVTEFGAGDVILGGDGSDLITGRAGDDVIDGDKWLNVRIAVHESVGPNGGTGAVLEYHDSMTTLASRMFSGEINPGQLRIHREIMTADGEGDTDIAVFSDDLANYEIVRNDDGSLTVTHVVVSDGLESDGSDRVNNIETLRFRDQDLTLAKPVVMLHAMDVGNYLETFATQSYTGTDAGGTTPWTTEWTETNDGPGSPTGGDIEIIGGRLRFDQNITGGEMIERSVDLTGAASATISFDYEDDSLDFGENVVVEAWDGSNWQVLGSLGSSTGNGNGSFSAQLSPAQIGAHSAIRFRAEGDWDFGENFYIDNVQVSFASPAAAPSTNYETTYTENGAGVSIASGPSITDDGTTLASAKIVLTNAHPGDDFDWGALPAGISASIDTSVEGQLTVNLTGTASLAAYQAAIQAVTFDSSSDNPSTEPRIIEVTVNDGFIDSDAAITTVNVVAANDAPNAVTDNIITNVAGPFVVPEWVMLLNDVDPDGNPLNVTGATENDANFTISFNAGDVTAERSDTDNTKDFTYMVSDGSLTDTADVDIVWDTDGTMSGSNGAETLIGNAASTVFDAQGGNDVVLAGAGADTIDAGTGDDRVFGEGGVDTIVWNANTTGDTDGYDIVDGGLGTDTFDVNTRANTAETYRVYTRAAAEAAGIPILGATTEIVITRQVGATTSIIAELDNIEEIRIGTQPGDPVAGPAGGGDTVQIFGDFSTTSLALNTITIDGNPGDDTIDISGLDSAHRIVFRSNGGNDTIIGNMRPEDVIELPEGTTLDDYVSTTENGVTTLTNGSHSITFSATGGMPQIGEEDPEENPPPPAAASAIVGTEGTDALVGTQDGDTITALGGADVVFGHGGDDDILGGAGIDMLYGDAGADRILGGNGGDLINGGAGNDTVFGGNGNDIIVAEEGDGNDTYYGDEMTGGAGIDTLDMSGVAGAITADLGTGFMGRGSVSSADTGNDTLWGIENFVGGWGNDTITASAAANMMDGGAGGDDVFRFLSAADADGDTITGFQPGDRIDLSAMDADGCASGNQSFTLVSDAFTGRGQVMVSYETGDNGEEYTIVEGNTSGGTEPDFKISIRGSHVLEPDDFNF